MLIRCRSKRFMDRVNREPEFELGVCGHVPHRELTRATLDILGLCRIPCWSVGCRHCMRGLKKGGIWISSNSMLERTATFRIILSHHVTRDTRRFALTLGLKFQNESLERKHSVFDMQERLNTFYKTACKCSKRLGVSMSRTKLW